MQVQIEDRNYKVKDYLARSKDFYSLTKYQLVLNWLPREKELRILNAGCGSGEMNLLLAQNKSWKIDALDIDEAAVSLSKVLKERAGIDNLQVFHSSIEDFQSPHLYDVIVSNDVLEHIEDDARALEKLHSLLKPNGYLCISVPAFQILFGYHDKMLGHYRRYSCETLANRVSKFFDIRKIRYFGLVLIPIVMLYSCLLKKQYPVERVSYKSLPTKLIKSILNLEAKFGSPIGISLILLARKS
ncbi:class I SAM-dependent methyltransferase [Oscillatoria sp. FACHB-1406]|uniref:class I SAM-dependent methyltransferase n=1 Tax=Oscillatoria sp. FACHB-1406 TaxID=2692846 RepID=UPI00168769A9|nr:class I SAM-dependent methyltransferase [Oscillatoria sp. FACHB-1406]MBD2577178.1 class I SAM-dependent methyltransferase [Oscillatoria sp. FACHB-1406]